MAYALLNPFWDDSHACTMSLRVSSCPQAMMRPCYSAIVNHAAGGKPAIVFVPTRKHVRLTALDLLTSAAADGNQHRYICTWASPIREGN